MLITSSWDVNACVGAVCSRGRFAALFLPGVVRVDVFRRRAALRSSGRGFRGRKVARFVVLLSRIRYAVEKLRTVFVTSDISISWKLELQVE